MFLKDRLKRARKLLKITQKNIAESLNCTDGKVKQIESGKTASITYDDAKILEVKFGINEKWLREGIGEMILENSSYNSNINMFFLPFHNDIDSYDDSSSEVFNLPKILLPSNTGKFEVFKVKDESMGQTFTTNDLIIVDKKSTEIINGKIFLILYEKEIFIKRIFMMPHEIILKSDNLLYPEMKVNLHNFTIIGQVVRAFNYRYFD